MIRKHTSSLLLVGAKLGPTGEGDHFSLVLKSLDRLGVNISTSVSGFSRIFHSELFSEPVIDRLLG